MPFHVEPAAATARWAAETLHTFLREKEEGRERAKFIRTLPVVLMKKDKALAEETPPEWTKIPELGFKVHASDVMAKHQEVRLPPGYGAWYFHAPVIHAEPYLSSMVDELRDKGVLTEFRRRFPSLRDAYKYGTELLDGDVHAVVNCTGMGANHICSEDQGVIPGRGVVLQARKPPGCDAVLLCEEEPFTDASPAYIIPRGDELVTIGGTYIEGDFNCDALDAEVEAIKKKAEFLYPKFKEGIEIEKVWVGLRPVRHAGLRLEVEGLEGTSAKVLHYFGQGGSGWTVMYGCAREGVDMLESSFSSEL